VLYVPDIGATDVKYAVRFARATPGGPVLEDRAFNLRSGPLHHALPATSSAAM